MIFDNNIPRIIVAQLGARRRYAVPFILEKAGFLGALYTDSSSCSGAGIFAKRLTHILKIKGRVNRLASRQITGIPRSKIFSTDVVLLSDIVGSILLKKRRKIEHYKLRQDLLGRRMVRWGTNGANCVYTMHHGCLPFVRFCKKKGLKVIVDVFIHPDSHSILYEEQKNIPEWGYVTQQDIAFNRSMWEEVAELSDLLLCPSTWVADGVKTVSPNHAAKIKIVPYGSSIDYGSNVNIPHPGRFFFAGGDALRKGLLYLGKAASLLVKDGKAIEIRVAGEHPPVVTHHEFCKDLHFLGKLNKEQMIQEFLNADAFILPSLSEGFAGVLAEALAAGCPVIATKESGVSKMAGMEEMIVASRDEFALQEKILKIYENRNLRERCAKTSLDYAKDLTIASWEDRLIHAITSCFKK